MAIQLSVEARNDRLDAIEARWGPAPIIEWRTGAQPANCAAAATGTLLAQASLPADSMSAGALGVKSKLGAWTFNILAGILHQTVGYFRIYDAGSPSKCHMQGSVGMGGSGADMIVDNSDVSAAQVVTVTQFDLTDGNA